MKKVIYSITMLTQSGPVNVGECKGATLAQLGDNLEEEQSLQLDSVMFRTDQNIDDDRLSVIGTNIFGEDCKYVLRKVGSEELATVIFSGN